MYKMGVYPSKLTRAGYCQKICIVILSRYQVVDTILQGCHGEGKMKFFPGHEKVREKLGNLKINGYGRQSSDNLFVLSKRGKDVLSPEIVSVSAHLPHPWRLLLKKRICFLGE